MNASDKPRGLTVTVYRGRISGGRNGADEDYSNGGVSGKHDRMVLVTDDEASRLMMLPSLDPDLPAVRIVKRTIGGRLYVHAEPVDGPVGMVGPMAGGTFVYSSDSRFAQITGVRYPISLHDRWETKAQYDALSI